MEDELYNLKITDRKSFVQFLNMLHAEFLKNGNEWENNTLERFLEAMTAYAEDIQGYYDNCENGKNANTADWNTFADILRGSIVYE